MGITEQDRMDSQNAVSEYLAKYKKNGFHSASVVVERGGKEVFNSSVRVRAKIETNTTKVEVEFDSEGEFYTIYYNGYCKFTWDGTALIITAEDKSKNAITISVNG